MGEIGNYDCHTNNSSALHFQYINYTHVVSVVTHLFTTTYTQKSEISYFLPSNECTCKPTAVWTSSPVHFAYALSLEFIIWTCDGQGRGYLLCSHKCIT